jgi:hypothetical protein
MNDYPHFRSPEGREAVTADLTASVAELAYTRDVGLGKAVDLTFRTLGIDRVTQPPYPSDLLVIGSTETIGNKLPDLRKAIGLIARESADDTSGSLASYRTIGNTLDVIAQHTLPRALDGKGGVVQTVGDTLNAFGQSCNDDGCGVAYGKRVGWYMDDHEEVKKLKALRYYAAKNVTDIGLLEIDQEKGVSYDTKILRLRARKYILDDIENTPKLKKGSRALREFEERLIRDATALERLKQRFAEQPGKGFNELILPEDIIHQLLDDELAIMERESS